MKVKESRLKKAYPPQRTRVATSYQQMRRRLRDSTTFLPPSSLAASLLTPPQMMDCKMRTRGAKSLPLQRKTRFVTT